MNFIKNGFIHFLSIGLIVLLTSCMPKPGSDQVRYNPQELGKLAIVESSQLGIMPVGEVQTIKLTLQNIGKLKVSFSPMQLLLKEKIQFVGDSYPGVGGSCLEVLGPGDSCSLVIQAFSSTVQGFNEPYLIEYLNGIGKTSLEGSFTGYFGTPARIDLSLEIGGQLAYDFDLVEPGTTKSILIEIENKGNLPANNFLGFFDSDEPIFHFTGGMYPGVNGTCSNNLNSGQKCYLDISVTPITPGLESFGSLKINYSNPIASKTFSLKLRVFSAELKAYLSVHEKFQQLPDTLNKGADELLPRVTWTVENVGLARASAITLTAGDVPFEFEATDCPEFLEPHETCKLTYKLNPQYEYPLPPGFSFPINYFEKSVHFSFLDSKNPLPVLSQEAKFNGKILDEALLVFNRDANPSLPFAYSVQDAYGSANWDRADWFAVIGDSVFPARNLSIVNPGVGARVRATNITFELTPDDGELTLGCSPNCPSSLGPGSTINTNLQYKPTYKIPYASQKDYLLKVTYNTGRRSKTYELVIETESKAIPLIQVKSAENIISSGANISLGSTLPGKPSNKATIQIFNMGPFDYTPTVNLVGPSSNFSIVDNNCASAVIKNGQHCEVSFQFIKNEYEESDNNFTHAFSFDNGLDSSGPDYLTFNFSLSASLTFPGEIEVNPAMYDLGTLPWSLSDFPAFKREAPIGEGIKVLKKADTWEVTKMNVELVGDDAQHFQMTPDFIFDYVPGTAFIGGDIKVAVTAPQGTSSEPRMLHAKLRLSYYGGWRDDFVSFDPDDVKEVDLYATVRNSPYVIITEATQDYGPIPETLEEFGIIKIKNIGQSSGRVTTSMPANKAFKILSLDTNTHCQQVSLDATENKLILDIAAGAECTLNISFSPKIAGNNDENFSLTYRNAGNTSYGDTRLIKGRGLNLARITITPANTNGHDLHEYGDFRLGQSLEKTFTFRQIQSDSTPAEIVNIALLPFGADCSFPAKVPTRWESKAIVAGNNIDFTITENSCSASQVMNTSDSCDVKINFQPQSMDKLIGSCLKITYKPFLSASPSQYMTTTQRLGGMGLAPFAIFNGWTGLYAEGTTETTPQQVKLQWKPMGVEDNLGTVVGYNVYRRKTSQNSYPSQPLNTSIITTFSNGHFEYIDSQVEERDSYEVPQEGGVYFYTVKPIITIPGVAGQVLTEATEPDRFIRMIFPLENTILLHRITANIQTCMNVLGQSYSQLDRIKSYNCLYPGFGGSGGVFDVGKDRLIDRYENSLIGMEPSNAPGNRPYLYSSLEAAKDSCVQQKATISDLLIFDKSKRLMNRQDYMVSSINQKRAGCIDNSNNLEFTGRKTCLSEFNVEDLIGNAWEFIDAQLFTTNKASLRWKLNLGQTEGRDWLFDIPVIDFGEIDILNPLSFSSRGVFSGTETKCINSIMGLPFPDTAGSCSAGNTPFNNFSSKMDLKADLYYFFTLNNFVTGLEEMEGKRYMLAGGSYRSKELFEIDINRFTIYWTEPTIETIFYSSNPITQWEGGAARCVLDVNY